MDNWFYPTIDWQEFHKYLSKQMPFMATDFNLDGIESFVQEAVNSMPTTLKHETSNYPVPPSNLRYNIFETHRSVFVRYRLPANVLPKSIRILANRRKLKIQHTNSSEEISLPSDVKTARTVAKIKQGILEIRMPKSTETEPFREIFIQGGV